MQTKETRASLCLLKFQGLALNYSKAVRHVQSLLVYISPQAIVL